jgi:hypothetical protein
MDIVGFLRSKSTMEVAILIAQVRFYVKCDFFCSLINQYDIYKEDKEKDKKLNYELNQLMKINYKTFNDVYHWINKKSYLSV